MSKKPLADLGGLVSVETPDPAGQPHTLTPHAVQTPSPRAPPRKRPATKLKKAGFLVHPTALRQFDVLKAELAGDDRKNVGVKLIAEALNLLFEKHGKPTVALDI